ncbi:MAG: Gfo/Idh/MocA family protein [Planctomycetota bacterium]
MTKKQLRVGMVGYNFMGKAHSNAWLKAAKFFALPCDVVMQAVCGRTEEKVRAMAENWGWRSYETDWKRLIERDDIDLIDICTPNNSHAEIAIAAAKAGKAITCEKPLAMNTKQAKTMVAAVQKAGVLNSVWFNYRRVPAVAFAQKLVAQGKIGRLFHVRAQYLQDWIIDPEFPLVWRLDAKVAGSGPHGDLNAHIIDMARFITGDTITETIAHTHNFITERPVGQTGEGLSAKAGAKTMKVTVEDAVIAMAKFKSGAIGTFEATRFAQGRKNGNRIELNGEKGSLYFEFEDMNHLYFYDATAPAGLQGFTKLMCTDAKAHPYAAAWWPAGHIIGYEHSFINQVSDVAKAWATGNKAIALPDFADATVTQRVLDAMLDSAKQRKWVKV